MLGTVDLRSETAFSERRLPNSINIPFTKLVLCWHEFPARNCEFQVLCPDVHIEEAETLIRERGWKRFSIVSELTPGIIDRYVPHTKPSLLFSPSPFLVECIELIESQLGEHATCCDIGCGSGRDSVWLASKSKASFPYVNHSYGSTQWSVTAVDCFPKMLVNAAEAASRVDVELKLVQAKISKDKVKPVKGCAVYPFHENKYDLVLLVRFCEKGFFPAVANMVREGGFVLCSTFSEVNMDQGPTSEARVLAQGEVATLLGECFDVLIDRIDFEASDGRPLNCFLAKRVSSASIYDQVSNALLLGDEARFFDLHSSLSQLVCLENQADERFAITTRGFWSVPPSRVGFESLKLFIGDNRVLSVGSGYGVWEFLLSQFGIQVVATDIEKPNESIVPFPIEVYSSVEAVNAYPEHECMLFNWPHCHIAMASEALECFSGTRLIYVGEPEGGCTGDPVFHEILREKWVLANTIEIPQWYALNDCIWLYTRRVG